MKLISIAYPLYRLMHDNGTIFDVKASKTDDGRLTFTPTDSWDDLINKTQQDPESLLDAIDDVIYNATPERFDSDEINENNLIKCPDCDFIYDGREEGCVCPECESKVRISSKTELDFLKADWADFYDQCEKLKGK